MATPRATRSRRGCGQREQEAAPASAGTAVSESGDDEALELLQGAPLAGGEYDLPAAKQLSSVFDSAAAAMAPPLPRPPTAGAADAALDAAGGEAVQVILRLRPLAPGEQTALQVSQDGRTVRATAPPPLNQRKEYRDHRDYTFTQVLGAEASQGDVYDSTTRSIVQAFVEEGKSGLVFTFGVTSSGKSFTVLGTKDQPGLIPRAVAQICAEAKVNRISLPHPGHGMGGKGKGGGEGKGWRLVQRGYVERGRRRATLPMGVVTCTRAGFGRACLANRLPYRPTPLPTPTPPNPCSSA